MRGQYQTQEQAAAAATHQLGQVGDEVYLHAADCFDANECVCTPAVIVLTPDGWKFGSAQ